VKLGSESIFGKSTLTPIFQGGALTRLKRLLGLLAVIFCGLFLSAPAFAECGGSQQCIAVSIDPSIAPAHGTPLESAPLDFGNQTAGTTSAARTILVAGVEGLPVGSRATLDAIALTGANATDFRITGGTCTVGTPTLLQDGNRVAQISNACTITVTFNPATVGVKNAQVNVQTTAITRVAPLTGTGTPSLTGPTAAATTLTVQVNTAATLDLAPFITGTVTGVSVVAAPTHGVATVSGTSVTYTPTRDYFGPDTFSYAAFNAVGSSAPAVVTVTVAGRPDPSKDANVIGLIGAQAQTVRRFSRTQIFNFQRRMESLHRGGADSGNTAAAGRTGFGRGVSAGPRGALTELGANVQSSNALRMRMAGEAGGLRPMGPVGTTLADEESTSERGGSPSGHEGAASGFLPTSLINTLFSAATTRSVNLASSSDRTDGSSALPDGTGLWIGGMVNFGTRDQTSDANSLRFSTDGISAGIDRRFSEKLVLGLGAGYARDETVIGNDGTKSRSSGSSIAVYGSYQPTRNTFVDGLLGYGTLSHDTDRFVPSVADFARANRKGDQWFGSVAAGYEHRAEGLLLSPYGRLDFARDRLKQASESGAGLNALTYFEQTLPTLQLSLGLRAESQHETNFGWALPRLRVEFKHDFEGNRQATIAYADQFAGPTFSVTPPAVNRNSLLVGIGSDFLFRDGLKLGVDYQAQRSSGPDRSQAIRFWISKELDGKGLASGLVFSKLYDNPVRVEAAYAWDDNLTRARDAADKLSDHIYSLNVSKGAVFPVTLYTRVVVSGFVNGDKLRTYTGLDRISGGVQGEFQYRASGEFDAPTFGIFGRASLDDYHSELRSGYRASLGVTARQSLTDRIDLFGALAGNMRHARNDVFDARDYSARFNLDYSLGRAGALYLGGEYRRGDTVTTAPLSDAYRDLAKVFVQDDAYGDRSLVAYRYEAKTVLWTLGYNRPLGPRDSIDFSWRQAQSRPTSSGATGLYATGSSRYYANQYSIAYLMRF